MIKHHRYLDFFPYPIFRKDQEQIIDQIEKSAREGKNILLVAPNGTGKTEDDNVIAAKRSRDQTDYPSRAIWLTQKDFQHILDRHTNRFNIFGISLDYQTIGNLIFQAITKYPIIKTEEGRSPGAKFYFYAVRRPGGSGYLHVLVDPNGHIVTAYTTRTLESREY